MSSPKSLHILFLTPGFPGNEQETNCLTYFQNYLLALKQAHPGIQLEVISLHYPFPAKNYLWHGIRVHALGGANGKIWKRPLLWRKAWRLVRRLHQEKPIDSIHSFWLKECCLLGHFLGERLKVFHLNTVMGTEVFSNNPYLRLLPLNRIKLICVSAFQREKLMEGKKLKEIPGLIPFGLGPTDLSISLPYQDRPYHLLNVGFLNANKQIPLFLQLVTACKQHVPQVRALLVGEDYSKGQLEAQIKQLGLQENVIKYPLLSNEEVIHLMGQSKVLVHTSAFESEGYVFLEALRSGMYVCSRKVGIAEAGKQWFTAESEDEFVRAILGALEATHTESILAYPVKHTVDEYVAIYER